MATNIYRGSKQATFPWEKFIAEHEVHASEVVFLIDDTKIPENPDVLTIAVSEDFDEDRFYDSIWTIKDNPRTFFEFQNGHINRNRVLDQLRSAKRTYIAPYMDSAYELVYLVKDFSSGVRYQVRGMPEPAVVPNPCRREYNTRGLLQKDQDYMKFFFVQLRIIYQDMESMLGDAPKVYGMYNIANIVFNFIVSSFHIYTTENKYFQDTFYSNMTVRHIVLKKVYEIYNYYRSIGIYKD